MGTAIRDWDDDFTEEKEPVEHTVSSPYYRQSSTDEGYGTRDLPMSKPHHDRARPVYGHESRPDTFLKELSELLYDDDTEIPALDEIPYAVILAGEIDENTLTKATLKQQQKTAMQSYKRRTIAPKHYPKSDKQSESKTKKNKNACLLVKNNSRVDQAFDVSKCKYSDKESDFTNENRDGNHLNDISSAETYYRASSEKVENKRSEQTDHSKSDKTENEELKPNDEYSPGKAENKTSEYTYCDDKITEQKGAATRKTERNKPSTIETDGSASSLISCLSYLMGLDGETDSDLFDVYDYGDFPGRNNGRHDEDDIPYAMKLGNMVEYCRKMVSSHLRPHRTSRQHVKQTQAKSKNVKLLTSSKRDGSLSSPKETKEINIPSKKSDETPDRIRPLIRSDDPRQEETSSRSFGKIDDNVKSKRCSFILLTPLDSGPASDDSSGEETAVKNNSVLPDIHIGAETVAQSNKIQENTADIEDEVPVKETSEGGSIDETPSRASTPTLKLSKDVLKLADSRHVAFKKLRSRTLRAEKLKCTACRRPECTSQNVKKMKEIIKIAGDEGYEIRDVVPDGNCMFAAVVDQLELHGEFTHNAKSLREQAVHWLIENPKSEDGTPYASFVEEEWEQYIQRMMKGGQWGDHIVLQAIAKILGRSIMILNPGESDRRWTRIEAGTRDHDVFSSSWVIFLGLAGEFHYMSLVPKDIDTSSKVLESLGMESMTLEEAELYSLEGVEDVSMFEEDYIDPWNDLPLAHFSFMLVKILPISSLEATAYDMASLYGEKDKVQTSLTLVGEVAEETSVPRLLGEPDILYFYIRQDLRVIESTDPSRIESDYCLDTRACQPGYTKIRFPENMAKSMKKAYMPHPPEALNQRNIAKEAHSKKQLTALPCSWPLCAETWKARPRREGWPSPMLIDSVVDGGCFLIPTAHNLSKSPETEWCFSFAVAEKKLMREGVSANQKYCYIIFKALCLQVLKKADLLLPEHLKQVFFYACERIPAEFWSSSIGACVVYIFDALLKCLREKNLQNYFVPSNNMINYLSSQDVSNIVDKLARLRSQLAHYLRRINERCKTHINGGYVIDKILGDIPSFKKHRSVRKSTLEVFVPINIEMALKYIRSRQYGEGFNMLNQAYEERLAVNTCDDSVPYQLFLSGALEALNHNELVWFSIYADAHFHGQIPMSIVSDVSGVISTVRISQVLPEDITAGYGNSLVPCADTRPLYSFCNEFAKFLYYTGRIEDCLSVLYFCRDKYKEKLKQGLPSEEDDLPDEFMIEIYTAICRVYFERKLYSSFDDLFQEFLCLCEKLNSKPYYRLLSFLGSVMGNTEMIETATVCIESAKEGDLISNARVSSASYWPGCVNSHHGGHECLHVLDDP